MTITANDVINADLGPICESMYDSSIRDTIVVGQDKELSNEIYQIAKNSYEEFGLALLRVDTLSQPMDKIEQVAKFFGFNSAFVPSQYSGDEALHNEFGINEISHDDDSKNNHEGFLSNGAQSVHVDGTLEKIGTVPTTFMLCQSQSNNGGESRVFNSVGAFNQLARKRPELANALCSDKALTRSDINRSGTSKTGPVFDINQYGLVTRFSLDNTSEWNVDEVENLQEALNWMKNKLTTDSDFYSEFKLAPGDLLIVANHKVSHGRNRYEDTKENRRQLYRALFQETL